MVSFSFIITVFLQYIVAPPPPPPLMLVYRSSEVPLRFNSSSSTATTCSRATECPLLTSRCGALDKGVQHISTICKSTWRAGSSPAGSISQDLNSQKLQYQCLTTSVAVVLVVR